jgi:hypothetical protein
MSESLPPAGSARDLPPVQPPSGRFIAQLFLVPGLIVFVVVLFVLAINFVLVRASTPDQILARLDSDNGDIRWRAANDLAQMLASKQAIALKTDVGFALDLCDRLDKALAALQAEEAKVAAKTGADDNAFRALQPQRRFVNFLAGAVGSMDIAAGVPVLGEMIAADKSPDVPNEAMRRRTAVWTLAKLGSQIKELGTLKPEQRQLVVSKLRTEAATAQGKRRQAAKTALFYMGEADASDPDVVRADDILARSADADDQLLRYHTAFALNFWDGPKTESTLVHLLDDRGQGTPVRAPIEP